MVSNARVVRFRILRKVLVWTVASLCAFILLTIGSTQIEQHFFRRRAKRLLDQIDALELRKTPWDSAKREFQTWGGAAKYDPKCNEHQCTLRVTLNDFVLSCVFGSDWPTRIDDYLRYRLRLWSQSRPLASVLEKSVNLSLYVGVRPAQIMASIGMRDGIVWEKSFSARTEVLSPPGSCSGGGRCPYTLIGTAYTVPRFMVAGDGAPSFAVLLHPNYTIGRPSGCMGCVMVWANFTPYVDPADAHRLMQFNLSCLTSWHPCRYESDIMPAAWAEKEAEQVRIKALPDQLQCSPDVLQLLGRDAGNIAVGEIVSDQMRMLDQLYHFTRVRWLEMLKRKRWKEDAYGNLTISADGALRMRRHRKFIFLFSDFSGPGVTIEPEGRCPIVPADEVNLNSVRKGIDLDYSARESVWTLPGHP